MTSATALKLTQKAQNGMQLFNNIHIECNPTLPEQIILYKHAILLHKMYNLKIPEIAWIAWNFQQLPTSRQVNFSIIKTNKIQVGNNIIANRFQVLINKIQLTDLNESISSFKINHKRIIKIIM